MATSKPSRFVLPQFFSEPECKELEFIHKSCGVVGYRPFVLSTTLSHLVATNCAHLVIPVLPLRERVKEVVEERFGREYELFIEFTGLISWVKGATIGWHSDNNRPYLQQRQYSAVCYLNDYEHDFEGGVFHFQDGDPSSIIPSLGTVVIYTADEQNVHCVDEITGGERCTLALWFTSDQEHDEDLKVIRQIAMAVPSLQAWSSDWEKGYSKLPPGHGDSYPTAASSVMYDIQSFNNEELKEKKTGGQATSLSLDDHNDLRVARLAAMGVKCCSLAIADDGNEHDGPVELLLKNQKVPHCFSNSLQALQVVQFNHQAALKMKASAGVVEHLSDSSHVKARNPVADSFQNKSKASIGSFSSFTETATSSRENSVNALPVSNSKGAEGVLVSDVCSEAVDGMLRSIWLHKVYTSSLWCRLFELFPSWRANGTLIVNDS